MTEFQKTDRGVSEMTAAELHCIALAGGEVGSIAYGYTVRGKLPDERHGYGFAWVATGGMGNCGTLVLTPRSPEASEYLRQGKVAAIMRDHGLDYADADALYSATKGVKYGIESGVLAYALQTRDCTPAWDAFPGLGKGVWRWHAEWQMDATDLSAPRLAACAEVVGRLTAA